MTESRVLLNINTPMYQCTLVPLDKEKREVRMKRDVRTHLSASMTQEKQTSDSQPKREPPYM